MPSNRRAEDRRWDFYYLAGMPAEICTGSQRLTPEEALKRVQEEHPGQVDGLRKAMCSGRGLKIGSVLKGRRFLLVCTG